MPIYAYRCESCGHQKDVLRKMSDPLLTQCPECGQDTFRKQVTAAGFQLKGSGWYVTDFRNGGSASKPAVDSSNGAKPGAEAAQASADGAKPASPAAASPASSSANGGATAAASSSGTPAASSSGASSGASSGSTST